MEDRKLMFLPRYNVYTQKHDDITKSATTLNISHTVPAVLRKSIILNTLNNIIIQFEERL